MHARLLNYLRLVIRLDTCYSLSACSRRRLRAGAESWSRSSRRFTKRFSAQADVIIKPCSFARFTFAGVKDIESYTIDQWNAPCMHVSWIFGQWWRGVKEEATFVYFARYMLHPYYGCNHYSYPWYFVPRGKEINAESAIFISKSSRFPSKIINFNHSLQSIHSSIKTF